MRVRRIAAFFAAVAATGYVAGCGVLWTQQRYLVFHDSAWKGVNGSPKDQGLDFEDVHIRASDGVVLDGWLVPAATPPPRTVLFFHGKGANLGALGAWVAMFHRLGWQALLVDPRGFGNSQGEPDEQGVYRDGEAAFDFLTHDRGLASRDVVVWGHSLGGGIASWVATARDPGALVLESTFTTLPDLGQRRYWFLPIKLLSSWRFDNVARVAQVRCPVVVAHSPTDDRIDYRFGQSLFAAAHDPKLFVKTVGGHNDGVKTDADAQSAIVRFLDPAR